jgi:hypothetical protein
MNFYGVKVVAHRANRDAEQGTQRESEPGGFESFDDRRYFGGPTRANREAVSAAPGEQRDSARDGPVGTGTTA